MALNPIRMAILFFLGACAVVARPFADAQDRPRFPSPTAAASARATPGYSLIEAEALVRGAVASAGPVDAQPMAGFGQGWSGNAQLFWAPPAANARDPATLKLTFDVPRPGKYSIRLSYTRAPDYGDFRFYIAGALQRELYGFAADVSVQRTTLADMHLDSGPTPFDIAVFRKDAKSRGYFVGIDSIELLLIEPGTNRNLQTSGAAGPQPAQQTPQPIIGPSAKLTFAELDANLDWKKMGAQEGTVYDSNLVLSFAWETAAVPGTFEWRWQVATQPFPAAASLTAPGQTAQGPATPSTFKINFEHVPPIGQTPAGSPTGLQAAQAPNAALPQAAPATPQVARASAARQDASPMDLYIRLVPLKNEQPAGPPSNTILLHYVPGNSPVHQQAEQGMKQAEEVEALTKAMLGYSTELVSFTPMKLPSRLGCVFVDTNPYAPKNSQVQISHPLAAYPAGKEYCPEDDPAFKEGNGGVLSWIGTALTGWALAYDGMAKFYNGTKAWIAEKVADKVPCEWLGDLEGECADAALYATGAALSAGMAALGVPPTVPDLAALQSAAEGDLVDTAVEFTCDGIEAQGGQCDAAMREFLRKTYQAGLDKLKEDAKRSAQEPDCMSPALKEAHKIPLPCFTDFPGTKVHPGQNSVYEPPLVKVQVTRTAPAPQPYMPCTLRATLHATNDYNGYGYINGQAIPAKQIKGELYVPATADMALLAQGQSATLTLAFMEVLPFSIASNTSGPHGTLSEWATLYWGGAGTLTLSSDGALPAKYANAGRAPCSTPATAALALPSQP